MQESRFGARRVDVMRDMTEWLLVLRSALNITQGRLAACIGISRQTYSALELGKKELTWNTFLSLFLFFFVHEKTRTLLGKKPGYIQTVIALLRADAGPEAETPEEDIFEYNK